MRRRTRALLLLALLARCGSPARPATPGTPPDLPEGLAGEWRAEAYGVELLLDPSGTFEWRQSGEKRKGSFSVDGPWLVLLAEGKYETRYAIVGLAKGQLTIRDPAGTQVTFMAEGKAAPPPVKELAPLLAGVWSNATFAVRIDLDESGSFVWKQGDLVETGSWVVDDAGIHMTTGGHTSTYRIVSVDQGRMTILDPAGNELDLSRLAEEKSPPPAEPIGKEGLLAGAPPIKIAPLPAGGGPVLEVVESPASATPPKGAMIDAGGIVHFVPPQGWKVDEQQVCGNKFTSSGMKYSCWNRNDLLTPDSARVHFETGAFVTWAAPGALDKISPQIDSMLATFDLDRTSASDEIAEMGGFEVFSTRIEGRASSSSRQLRGRIIGVHYGDLLVVCVLALGADPATLATWGEGVQSTLDSMAFHFAKNTSLASAVQGTWKDSSGGSWSFWSDMTCSVGGKACRWMVVGSTVVLAADPQGEGAVSAHPARIEGGVLTLGDEILKK